MDPKPIVAGAAAVALIGLHLKLGSGPGADHAPQVAERPPLAQTLPPPDPDDENSEQARREAHFDKFRDDALDTSKERAEKEMFRRMTLLGQNPIEFTGDVEGVGGARDVEIVDSEESLARFVADGGTISGPTELRPSQLPREDGR